MQRPTPYEEKWNIHQRRRTHAHGINQGCCCCLQILVGIIALALLSVAIAIPFIISLKSSSTDAESTPTTSIGTTINTTSAPVANSTTISTGITSNSTWANATTSPTNPVIISSSAAITSMTSALMTTMSSCLGPLLLTFDDIINASNTQGGMPNLYNCFNWINGWYLNTSTVATTSGYRRALTSGEYIILNRNGTVMSMTTTTSSFDIFSFVASSGYATPLHLSLQGLQRSGVVAYNRDVLVYNNTGTMISLNWTNLTTVTIGSYYYHPIYLQNFTGLGYQFSIDNINTSLS